jgi:hypothetical protein
MTVPFGESVVQHVRTRGTPDALGNDTWTDTDTTHPRAVLYPRVSVELAQGQDTNIIGLTAVFIPAITVSATDEFTARGERWAVAGLPGQFDSPFTGKTVTQIHLSRVEG